MWQDHKYFGKGGKPYPLIWLQKEVIYKQTTIPYLNQNPSVKQILEF